MNAKRLFHVSLPVLLLWLVSLPVHAAVEAGRILFARGTVSIVDASDAARGAGTGSVFHEGDRVVTGNNSIVQLRLSDGALTALRSNSDYQIQRQRFDEEADVYEQAGRLLSGWMRSVTGAIGARYPGNVSQGTSVATIGIRGTTYQIIHVPEEGLAEFPNLQPGTYVYLEEGQVEVSNAAGSRIVSPGQVVRVPGPDAAPELAPELTELFQSEVLQGAGSGDSDGVTVRDLLADASSEIVDNLTSGTLPEFASEPFALSGGCSTCQTSVNPATGYAGEGNSKYLTGQFLTGGDIDLQAIEGKLPAGTGSIGLYSAGELVSQLHWGRWLEGDYTEYGSPGESGAWHYIMADNVLESPSMIFDTGLTGTVRYNYAGGSVFTGTDSDLLPVSPTTLSKQSFLEVDFSQFQVFADLAFANGDVLTGATQLESFYSGGIFLTNGSETAGADLTGAFVGQNAEGIMSLINYYAFDQSFTYWGSAVFQREPTVPQEMSTFGGVSVFSTSSSPSKGVLDSSMLQVALDASGINLFPTYAQLDTGAFYELIGNSTEPSTPISSHNILDANDNILVNVYWGLWDQNSYLVNEISEGSFAQTPTSDWHFMIADNPLTESMVASIGLTGQYTYNFVDGTPLIERNGIYPNPAIIGASSTVVVDFTNLMQSNGIVVNLDISALNYAGTLSGQGSLGNMYSPVGITLLDAVDQAATGSFSGTFAGSGAEALLGAVTVDYNTESYIGTALFQQDPTPIPVTPP